MTRHKVPRNASSTNQRAEATFEKSSSTQFFAIESSRELRTESTEGQPRCAENRPKASKNEKQNTIEITSCTQLCPSFTRGEKGKQGLIGSFTGCFRCTVASQTAKKARTKHLPRKRERDNLSKHMRSQTAEDDARELTSGGLLGWLAEMLHWWWLWCR